MTENCFVRRCSERAFINSIRRAGFICPGIRTIAGITCLLFALLPQTLIHAAQINTKLHSLGLVLSEPSQPPAAKKVAEELRPALQAKAQRLKQAAAPAFGPQPEPPLIPPSADNSAGLPPVGDQGAQGSCVSWACGYYMKTYQEGKERNWSLSNPAHQFSPAFLYHQLQGFDEGSTFEGNLDLLINQGCATLDVMPYSDSDYLTWPTAAQYREGIPYRELSWDYLGNGETESVFDTIKAILASGDACAVGIPIYRPDATTPGNFDALTAANPYCDLPPASDTYLAGYHALCIVGYDESKFDGRGGYKIINSWGTSWGASGFAWISEPFLITYGLYFYRMTDRIAYQPTSYFHWKVSHPFWGWTYDNVTVTIGVGSTNAPLWSKVLVTSLERDSLTIDMWYDISDCAAFLPPDFGFNRWWIKIGDSCRGDVAGLSIAEIEDNGAMLSASNVLPQLGPIFGGDLIVYIPAGEIASNNYYVNDNCTSGDIYCSAPGNDSNDGLTSATPKCSLQAIIDLYTLKGNDRVWIDAGTYDLDSDITINNLDRGTSGKFICFIGASASNGEPATIFYRSGGWGGSRASFSINGTKMYLLFKNMAIQGGEYGFNINGSWDYGAWNYGPMGYGSEDINLENIRISNTVYPAYLYEAQRISFCHCVFSDFFDEGVHVGNSTILLENSIIAAASSYIGTGISCIGASTSSPYGDYGSEARISLRHCILSAQNGYCIFLEDLYPEIIDSDYNNFFTTGTSEICSWGGILISTLPQWQAHWRCDQHSLSTDPLFADVANHDFHLKSITGRWNPLANGGLGGWTIDTTHSLCIDAGDIFADASAEPIPNGGRINIGAYGGTPYASKSSVRRRYLFLDNPTTGNLFHETIPVVWRQYGDGWQVGSTIRIEYSANAGQSWQIVEGADNLPYTDLAYTWNLSNIASGTSYTLRLIYNQDSSTSTSASGLFIIERPTFYYVNDSVTANDVYCVAPGNDANDGLTSATPKASIQTIIDTYRLKGSDIVYIDTGIYALTSEIAIGSQDCGDSLSPVQFVGSTHTSGTLINFNNLSYDGFKVSGNYISLENLRITGARFNGVFIYNASNSRITQCRIYGNSQYGVYLYKSSQTTIANSIIDRNGLAGFSFYYSDDCVVRNNTIVLNSASQIYIDNSTDELTIRNNILWADGSGHTCVYRYYAGTLWEDYNDLYATNGASIGIALGSHNLSRNPIFVNPAGPDNISGNTDDDFHLQSTAGSWHDGAQTPDAMDSFCIDTGDPSESARAEPQPNGGRINMGAYGGTEQASMSTAGCILALIAPNGGEVWKGIQSIRWACTGLGWQAGDTIRIDYSSDSGLTWHSIPGAQALPYSLWNFNWNTTTAIPSAGPFFRVRIISNHSDAVSDTSDSSFTLHNHAICYYVNDAITINDIYCIAAGNDANDGLTSATPKASVQAILDTYDLEGGDIVYIDTGVYVLKANIIIGAKDSGDSLYPVHFVGSTHTSGTLINRNDLSSGYGFVCGSCISLENLRITGAEVGVQLASNSRITQCRIYGNSQYGISLYDSTQVIIENCIVDHNGTGFYFNHVYECIARNNTIVFNTANQIYIEDYSWNNLSLRNNILWADGAGHNCVHKYCYTGVFIEDYNDLYATNNANIGISYGPHDFCNNPLFVNSAGPDNIPGSADDDFHLQSTAGSWHGGAWAPDAMDSPCIDAADLADSVGAEPQPNGGRINMGAYGGTAQASKSPARVLELLSPKSGDVWKGIQSVRWAFAGQSWRVGDTIRIKYSADSGQSWQTIPGAKSLSYAALEYTWDLSRFASGTSYSLRLICNQDALTSAIVCGLFSIESPTYYYVNDSATTNDVYCIAPGNDANDGLTSSTPKESIQAILDAYQLKGSDVVFIDTGIYVLEADISIGSQDSGDSLNLVRFVGSTHTSATLIKQSNLGSSGFYVSGNYISLENLRITGATNGVFIYNASNSRITQCRIYGNSQYGVYLYKSSQTTIANSMIDRNGLAGFSFSYSDDCVAKNNTIVLNTANQIDIDCSNNLTLRNNILWADGASHICVNCSDTANLLEDYNDLYVANGARIGIVPGPHDLSCDPLFVNLSGPDTIPGNIDDDFHLQSLMGSWHNGIWAVDTTQSLCIDGGNPSDSFTAEPAPNGGRINIGAYGGTVEASMSLELGRGLVFNSAGNREPLHAFEPLWWTAQGSSWTPGETVRLEVSPDSGNTWQAISGAESLPAGARLFWWDSRTVLDGDHYCFRVMTNIGIPIIGTSTREYSIHNLQAPCMPYPTNGATCVAVNTSFEWHKANGATFYDIYLWKSTQTKPIAAVTSVSVTSYNLPYSLAFGTTYKWQILARNAQGQTAGLEWTFTTEAMPADLYVDGAGGSDMDGDGSQLNPFKTIGMAMSIIKGSSISPCAIHVAEGLYKEAVIMQDYVSLFGGYLAGSWIRDTTAFISIIDGEHSRSCVTASNNSALDGFTLRNGSANNGGGIYMESVSPTISDCKIERCTAIFGGGIYSENCSALITQCNVTSCTASGGGGAFYLSAGYPSRTPDISCCLIANCAASYSGGAFVLYDGTPKISRCLITSCTAGNSGGGIYSGGSSPQITNNLIVYCRSKQGAGIFVDGIDVSMIHIINCTLFGNQSGIRVEYTSDILIKNSILWSNGDDLYGINASSAIYCDIEDGDFAKQNGNISVNPSFINAAKGDFHLVQGSPCIDAANSQGAPVDDLDGMPRPMDAGFDIGCYEADLTRPKGTVIVSVLPRMASWSFQDRQGGIYSGIGSKILNNILAGQVVLTWQTLSGFDAPTTNPNVQLLTQGETVTFTGRYTLPRSLLMDYLLRRGHALSQDQINAADINGDGCIDIADLIALLALGR
ncbi:MAG: right-handed parallel beta-helix repeat-containing protein [Candidatus Sumerlaeota bacterium]|nr:right-handed parallel beta-helix repeat-containing protein [Candidatus Sumerlaeota bacterium]